MRAPISTDSSISSARMLRLVEALRMTGLREAPYWGGLVLFDGVGMGLCLSFALSVFAAATGLFHDGGAGYGSGSGGFDFGGVWGVLFLYCLALTSLAFALSTAFDTPQSAGQLSFLVLLGGIVAYTVVCMSAVHVIDTARAQALWCLLPPFALQLAITRLGSTVVDHSFTPTLLRLDEIAGMLALDVALYAALAWYLGQILPSEFGTQRPPWFPLPLQSSAFPSNG